MNIENDISDVLELLKSKAPAGYAMALHVRFTTPTFLFQTYPRDWIDYYSQNGLVMRDPTVRWGFENTGLVSWSALVPQDEAGVLTMAAERGMKYGFTYAAETDGSRSVSSFSRGDRDFTAAEMAEIAALVDDLHDRTAIAVTLSPETHDQLRKLSIFFTHP